MPRPQFPHSPPAFHATREEAERCFRLTPPGGGPNSQVIAHIARESVKLWDRGWGWKVDPAANEWFNREAPIEMDRDHELEEHFIYGALSEFLTAARLDGMAQLLALVSSVAVPDSHHHVMIERPRELVPAIAAMMKLQGIDDGLPRDTPAQAGD